MTQATKCTNCGATGGVTTCSAPISYFKDSTLTSFNCEKCGHKSVGVTFGETLPDFGIKLTCKIASLSDMQKTIIRSEHATVQIKELGESLTLPKATSVDTVQSLLEKAELEPFRVYSKSDALPFTIIINDSSGNSYIDNPYNIIEYYVRSKTDFEKIEENKEEAKTDHEKPCVDYSAQDVKELEEKLEALNCSDSQEVHKQNLSAMGVDFSEPLLTNPGKESSEVIIETPCYACPGTGKNRTCICSIPHFKELIVMCFECDFCGYKNTEIKGGGGISEKARKISVRVMSIADLGRDVYKSETCAVVIPELGLEAGPGTIGSMYTTIEGLVKKITENLTKSNPFKYQKNEDYIKYATFLKKMERLIIDLRFTLVLDDPLSNSFISSTTSPDPQLVVEDYERTEEQDEELGILDMDVN